MTEEELIEEFANYPHGELVRAVYQMKTELLVLYDAVNKMAEMQSVHSKVLAMFVSAFEEFEAEQSEPAPRPGMYL